MSSIGTTSTLAANEHTTVRRIEHPNGTGWVISKEANGPAAAARIRHERSIIGRLADVAGVVRLISDDQQETYRLLQEDAGGMPADLPLAPERVVDVALRLARIVEGLHRARVMHRDINPDNILFSRPDLIPQLIDFDLATTFAEVRPAFTHPSEILGQLPYLAPEQTGRTAWAVDQRADLYGLGATIYALATGSPPFTADDLLQLLHDILTRVPVTLAAAMSAIDPGLSPIVARLLEKEPGRRYQSAAGLVYDLNQLATGDGLPQALGSHDFPEQLLPPSQPVGRSTELAALHAAFAGIVNTDQRTVLVTGSAGIGKSTLINQIVPAVTRLRGWFISAKHDQYRQDNTINGVMQALQVLTRMLLAQPDEVLASHRRRIAEQLSNVHLAAATLPEVAVLLQVPYDPAGFGDDSAAQFHQTALEILRAVATPEQPVVLVLDDLQWASSSALRFVDAVVTDTDLRGLLLIGAYRDNEVDDVHPLTAMRLRWERMDRPPVRIGLTALGSDDQSALVAEMLKLPPPRAQQLAELLVGRCDGNPYATTEMINALRQDGVLVLRDDGWHWDDDSIRGYVGSGDVIDLLYTRLAKLPHRARRRVRLMAVLGSTVSLDLVATAAGGGTMQETLDALTPALEEGLLTLSEADGLLGNVSVGFRHDRVQQAAQGDVGGGPIDRLAVARRLAAADRFHPEAVEQYLTTWTAVESPGERARVVSMFDNAAADALRVSNYATAERLLQAACAMADDSALLHLRTVWHRSLYLLGRLDEADGVYADLIAMPAGAMTLVPAICTQINSVLNRAGPGEAVALGLDWMGRLGYPMPAEGIGAAVQAGLVAMSAWIASTAIEHDLRRPELSDPGTLAASMLIDRILSAAFVDNHDIYHWLIVKAHAFWQDHGPHAELVAALACAGSPFVARRADYQTGARITRHVIEVAEGRGYSVAHARFLYVAHDKCWVEPLEDTPRDAAVACEGLIQIGDLQQACFTFFPALSSILDTGTLDRLDQEVKTAFGLADRTANEFAWRVFATFHQLVEVLTGKMSLTEGFEDEASVKVRDAGGYAAAYSYLHQALAAAVLGRGEVLSLAIEQTGRVLYTLTAQYGYSLGLMLSVVARTEATRRGDPVPDRFAGYLPADIERWFAARAAEAPVNFRHLYALVRAENAWTAGDHATARAAFDEALLSVDDQRRSWHHPLIAERAANHYQEQGLFRMARVLTAEANSAYAHWGATAKVGPPATDPSRHPASRGVVVSDEIDMRAILAASQAISSAVDLSHLQAAVDEQLRAVAGATSVTLLVRDGEADVLYVVHDGDLLSVEQSTERHLVPQSVLRYVRRTNVQLVLDDALADDRFRYDPYFADLRQCSVLALPIVRQTELTGLLILESRISRGAFTEERLDAVRLIGGQLAVSVGNAILYRTLERRITDRTHALHAANQKLEQLSFTDALTEIGNRRHFNASFSTAWADAATTGETVSFALVDVDNFKKFNDRYGHPAGDDCLRRIAQAMKQAMRDSDGVFRYGGEEFALLLNRVDAEQVAVAAERVRVAVAALGIPHEANPLGIVTISIGVSAAVASLDAPPSSLIEQADLALYRAKQDGRNRVVVG